MREKEQPNYYAIIPASVKYYNNLKFAEKLLYGEITALANKNGFCYAQNKYFADLYNVTIISISRWISHLKELGYIKTEIIRNENKEIISRNIYIVDIPYYQKNQYPYIQKSTEGINKIVKDNNIKYNTYDLFCLIINNSEEIPKEFIEIIARLEFNYEPHILQCMTEAKIYILKNIIYVLYELYNSNFKFILQKANREHLINLYFQAMENKPDNLLSYYRKSIRNSSRNCKKMQIWLYLKMWQNCHFFKRNLAHYK